MVVTLSTFPFNTKYLVNPIFKTILGFCIGLPVYILLVRVNPVVDENKKEECGRRNGLITSVYMCSFKEGDPCTTPEVYRLTSRFMSC